VGGAGLVRSLQVGKLSVEVYGSTEAMGIAAAQAAAGCIRALARQSAVAPVIFATGASQMATLEALTSMPGLPWDKVVGFHMDEYVGMSSEHPASFRRYLRERLTDRVKLRGFYGIDSAEDAARETAEQYAELLDRFRPQLCLLGIGENGHLAFNDPAEADFNDPLDVKIVELDDRCRRQQVNEGWFESVLQVPRRAITLTIPALFRVPQLIVSVPGERKAEIVKRTLTEEITPRCPATILRNHPNATVYLDPASAAELPS
jgi:glucosamine-6-phosphate deaminase